MAVAIHYAELQEARQWHQTDPNLPFFEDGSQIRAAITGFRGIDHDQIYVWDLRLVGRSGIEFHCASVGSGCTNG